ncbi:hypothetical protein [Streptomyces sp. WAC05858]|uniref:hypothetical protein n=1 Tax=Streptomyces TaxID=1883 RepID=UPI00163C8235|nr:hypothetical protein [Streptomyces sp. WAC05858]
MSIVWYLIGTLVFIAAMTACLLTPIVIVHARTEHDHGPGCWWCHPRLPRRRNHR